jgi:hypothetical protein
MISGLADRPQGTEPSEIAAEVSAQINGWRSRAMNVVMTLLALITVPALALLTFLPGSHQRPDHDLKQRHQTRNQQRPYGLQRDQWRGRVHP